MDDSVPSRRQATLFFNDAPPALKHCRQSFNPIQAALIPAHITLCREDEVFDWNAFERRVATLRTVELRLEFGSPIRSGNSVLLPAVNGIEEFAALRRVLLSDDNSEPRPMNPHVTIIHPRNGNCTNEVFAEIDRLLQPFQWTFSEISLIEQENAGPWKTLVSYS